MIIILEKINNMLEEYSRLALLIGEDNLRLLEKCKVAVFGLGGVGGQAVEALARSNIGNFVLIDDDVVNKSNINRQIIATKDSVGRKKTELFKERILAINPKANVETFDCFYLPDKRDLFNFKEYDFVIDAIDTVSGKLDLIETCINNNINIISAMGCGNRLDPTMIRIGDIYKTKDDPLAKIMRKELKKRRINKLMVVYSLEKPIKPLENISDNRKRSLPGSSAFVPPGAGLAIASYVVRKLINME